MQLLTLGGLRLDAGDFTRPKPLLLLCYLTIEGSQSRRVLADLFFADTKDPRDSLSTAFRQLCSIDADVIVADGDRLASAIANDATKLIEALDAGLLEPAIDLYEGAFLDGLDLELSEEIEEWVFTTREYLAGRVREAHLRVGERLARERDASAAAQHAENALDLAGAPTIGPDELLRTYRLLTLGHSPKVKRLEDLAEEFGLDLSELEEQRDSSHLFDIAPSTPNNLSPPTTSFVGRDVERLEIAKLLSEPHGRILTIHGPGGIGKSRLALRIARDQLQEAGFRDGVFLVDLEPIADPERIAETIATAMGEARIDRRAPVEQLAATLGERRVLLILDGFEHLVDGAKQIAELTRRCTHLRVIVTSRALLHLAEEHVITLAGLPLPNERDLMNDAVSADSLQLILHRGRKARHDFRLEASHLNDAVWICRRLEGSPLGIELAMAWARVMPMSAIRSEVERDLSFLESSSRNVRGSHGSLRAVFERSWNLLGAREREALPKLAVFQGGFRREAAAAVAGTTLPVLVALVDASLLSVSQAGRYSMHAIIRQYCLERLRESEAEWNDTRRHYREHYRGYAADLLRSMYTHEEPQAISALNIDLVNVLEAWGEVFELHDEPQRDFSNQFVVFFERAGLAREGIRFFENAVDVLRSEPSVPEHLLAEVQASLAWLHYRTGGLVDAEGCARAAIEGSDPDSLARMMASNVLGLVRIDHGDAHDAAAQFEKAIAIARERDEPSRVAMYLLNLAHAQTFSKRLADAKTSYERAIQIAVDHDYTAAIAVGWNNYAAFLEDMGQLENAIQAYETSLELAENIGDTTSMARTHGNLAETHAKTGNIADARRHLEHASKLLGDRPHDGINALLLHVGARIDHSKGDVASAEDRLERALELARAHPESHRIHWIKLHLAETWLALGREQDATALLRGLVHRDSVWPLVREEAERIWGSLRATDTSHQSDASLVDVSTQPASSINETVGGEIARKVD